MKDRYPPSLYNEIAQGYAKVTIQTVALVNGGAMVAVASQLPVIYQLSLTSAAIWSMYLWGAGLLLACLAGMFGFFSARHVAEDDLASSNIYLRLGLIAVIISILAFATGAIRLAIAFSHLPSGLLN
ncbi:MAG: hypothetical protein H5U24_09305 [Thioclava marina]|uniref:hypothetical protein n=1 Tax=Thioclava marina TaxID=1915077 RepID=UPI0019A8C879|nr:hypothetical protein [Thioclava marina]MBC7145587.1 hypothetical protein [Thioclava marina]TNF12303.1 MAG: hypothetical protein EP320_12405 [Paracoccaceae bacterium]